MKTRAKRERGGGVFNSFNRTYEVELLKRLERFRRGGRGGGFYIRLSTFRKHADMYTIIGVGGEVCRGAHVLFWRSFDEVLIAKSGFSLSSILKRRSFEKWNNCIFWIRGSVSFWVHKSERRSSRTKVERANRLKLNTTVGFAFHERYLKFYWISWHWLTSTV